MAQESKGRASEQLRISNALLSTLGVSDRDLILLVASCLEQSNGSGTRLKDLLCSEVHLSNEEAALVTNALRASSKSEGDEVQEPLKKRQRVEVPEIPIRTKGIDASEDKPVASSILDDPVLAAKAGLFEKLKNDPLYISQLREEVSLPFISNIQASVLMYSISIGENT